jgi:hypothetical protein
MKLALSAETSIFLLDLEILFTANHQSNRVSAVFKTELTKGLGFFAEQVLHKSFCNCVRGDTLEHISSSGPRQYLQVISLMGTRARGVERLERSRPIWMISSLF